ncbi:MAG: TlpA family protein disulfide reductase [Leptonema sp. (in: Bacteria)]|nr:TlpA family protein disulfide reductase [Leptonema sp. (in: bacteria)]
MNRIVGYLRDNLSTVVIISILIAIAAYQRVPMYQTASQMEAKPAPEFELIDLEGNRVSLNDAKGKVVLLNFWATWCLPCRVEIPILKSLESELSNHGLEVWGITQESKATVTPFVIEKGMNYRILFDSDGSVSNLYNIVGYPTIVMINRDGQIERFTTGLNLFMKWQIRRMVTGSFI